MLKIRKAKEKDNKRIVKVLKDIDLYYEGISLENFWIAEKDWKIVGTAQLTEYKNIFFLGSVCVVKEEQGKGIAKSLLKEILKGVRKDTYLYTVIPEFFAKYGFEVAPPIPELPSKNRYDCEYCFLEKCVCMLRRPDDT